MPSAANHRGHDAPRPGFQRPHDGGVIGGVQPNETVDADTAGCASSFLDLRDGEADVFLIEPDGIEAAGPGDHLDEFRGTELTEREDADQSLVGEQGFEVSSHRRQPLCNAPKAPNKGEPPA